MKNLLYVVGGVCAAAAGFLAWQRSRHEGVQELAHRLEEAWTDHHTIA